MSYTTRDTYLVQVVIVLVGVVKTMDLGICVSDNRWVTLPKIIASVMIDCETVELKSGLV
jgi:hypothetical protein